MSNIRKRKKINPLELERRWLNSRKPTSTVQQVFDGIENSDAAIKKLFLNEPLTDKELDALMKSDYLALTGNMGQQASTLYEPSKLNLAVASPILFTSIELEVLSYFGRYPELLYSLSSRKFEELVATVFRNNGFDVELTPETRDGGVDIFAIQKNGFAGSTLHIVECKRYRPENKVGIGVVQRMLGVVEQHRATQGIIVMTTIERPSTQNKKWPGSNQPALLRRGDNR